MKRSEARWKSPGVGRLRAAPAAADQERVRARLEALGVRPIAGMRLTDNRSVMVSFSRRRMLSLHRGYARAPDRVLQAIVRFIAPGAPRAVRKAAERVILSFPVPRSRRNGVAQRSQGRERPEDAAVLARLRELFEAYNERHFGGTLPAIPIRLSGRMRTRLGHLTLDAGGRPTDLTIGRRHVAAHGWSEVAQTLLHEMVHLWQYASGQPVDHGRSFRAKAREVGAHAAARRWVRRGRGPRYPHGSTP